MHWELHHFQDPTYTDSESIICTLPKWSRQIIRSKLKHTGGSFAEVILIVWKWGEDIQAQLQPSPPSLPPWFLSSLTLPRSVMSIDASLLMEKKNWRCFVEGWHGSINVSLPSIKDPVPYPKWNKSVKFHVLFLPWTAWTVYTGNFQAVQTTQAFQIFFNLFFFFHLLSQIHFRTYRNMLSRPP